MTYEEEILNELRQLNHKIDKLTSPLQSAWLNFVSGVFRSLGGLFGTIVIAGALFYFFSKVDLVGPMTKWIETILSQIQWEKVVPTPKVDNNQFNDLFNSLPKTNF